MGRSIRAVGVASVVLALLAALAGCQFAGQGSQQGAAGKGRATNPATGTALSGVRVALASGLPTGFPGDVPVGADAKIIKSSARTASRGTWYTVTYVSPQDPATLSTSYLDQIKAQGWIVKLKTLMGAQGAFIIAEKPAATVNMAIGATTKQPGFKSVVTVSTGPK